MKEPTSKSIVGNYQHTDTHTQVRTHQYIWAVIWIWRWYYAPMFNSWVFSSFLIANMKAGVLPGEKAKWLNSSMLPTTFGYLFGGRACVRDGKRRPDEDICFLTAGACGSARVGLFASILPFMWGFVIAMLFLWSSSRKKHNKSLFRGWISRFLPAERGGARTEELGVHVVNSRNDDGRVDAL